MLKQFLCSSRAEPKWEQETSHSCRQGRDCFECVHSHAMLTLTSKTYTHTECVKYSYLSTTIYYIHYTVCGPSIAHYIQYDSYWKYIFFLSFFLIRLLTQALNGHTVYTTYRTTLYCGKAAFSIDLCVARMWYSAKVSSHQQEAWGGRASWKVQTTCMWRHTDGQHTHTHLHTQATAVRLMGCAWNQGSQVTASDCQRTHPVTHALDKSAAQHH